VKPVRIKYYGLFWMTKFAYFVALAAAASFALVLVVVAAALGVLPRLGWPWVQTPVMAGDGLAPWFVNHFYFILLLLGVAQVLDVVFVLRAFAAAEAEQSARLDALAAATFADDAPSPEPRDAIQARDGVRPPNRAH